MSKKDVVYEAVTQKILETMEKGIIPWHKPWSTCGLELQSINGHAYRGINVFILACEAMHKGYDDPRWVTYRRAKELGGQVRKGEKSTQIVFFKPMKSKKESAEEEESRSWMLMKFYNVFNVEQCDWEDGSLKNLDVVENDNDPIDACEVVVKEMPNAPKITHRGARCCYSPTKDSIQMAKCSSFDGSEEYYATLFHELAHSTGHASRLGRLVGVKAVAPFGSEDYGKEELVAELAAAFVCNALGVETRKPENAAAYIQGWMKTIKADKKVFLQAAQQAQKAADWILNRRKEQQ